MNDAMQFAEARLRSKVEEVVGNTGIGNGTPAAAVLVSAVLADARAASAAATLIDALTEDVLHQMAVEVICTVGMGHQGEIALPFGTAANVRLAGGITIGDAHLMLDAGRPGLHPIETMRRDAHGPNLDRLRELIARKTRRLACRGLGLPSPSSIATNEMRHNLQFAPCPEAGGVSLQRSAADSGADRFCAATAKQLDAFATSIVSDMRKLWTHRKAIGARVEAVRAAAEAQFAAEHGKDGPVQLRTITVDLSAETFESPVCLYLEIEALDEALRPGTVLDFIPGGNGVDEPWFRIRDHFAFRTEHAAELAAMGATGWIDDLAAAVAAAAPGGQAAVLKRLAHELEARVVLPTPKGDIYATLYWQNGFIAAEVSKPGRLDSYSDRIEVRAKLPATFLASAVSKPFNQLVDLPFSLSVPIDGIEECRGDWLKIRVEYGHSPVNCETGEIFAKPVKTGTQPAA